jgi:hypothetical protein
MVYRKRWPVAVYNGPREVQALIDYSLTLACEAGYYEPLQTGGSMQGENRVEMGPYGVYANIPGNPPRVRLNSLEYNSSEPIRGFNPNIPVVATGSSAASQATNVIRSEESQQQQAASQGISTSLTQNLEQPPVPPSRLVGEQPPVPPSRLIGAQAPIQPTPSPSPSNIAVPVQQPISSNLRSNVGQLPQPSTVLPQSPTIALPANR